MSKLSQILIIVIELLWQTILMHNHSLFKIILSEKHISPSTTLRQNDYKINRKIIKL